MRLDKWLWVARFFKTRALATEEVGKGRVLVNGQPAKPSKEVHVGDTLDVRLGPTTRALEVRGLSPMRGSATVASVLYEESAASVAAREQALRERREGLEPSMAIEHGRPTKRDRRDLAEWNRWTASIDGDGG